MKKYLLLLVCLSAFCFTAPAQSQPIVANPIELNYRFQFDDPSYREAADPVCEYFQGKYYLFASKSGGYWSSPDLATWTYIPCKTIPEIEAYAPSILVRNDSIYYIASGTKIYRTAHPDKDEWQQIPTKFNNNTTDPAFFQDEDGKVYLYWGCSDKDPIMGVEVNPSDGFARIGTAKTLILHHQDQYGWEVQGDNNDLGTAGWNEGPAMIKYKGKYYLQYASPGTQFRIYADGVYVGDNPLGPFTYMENSPFSFKPGGFIGGSGHGHTFQDKYGNYWHVATMKISVRHMFERRVGLFPVYMNDDDRLVAHTAWTDYPFSIPGQKVDFATDNRSMNWNLLSYGKPVSASSTYLAYCPNNANDERVETWWAAQTGNAGEWWQVDLEKPLTVRAIQVNFADQNFTTKATDSYTVYQYKIEASDNGNDWTTIIDKTQNTADKVHELIVLDTPAKHRYLRITNTKEMPGRFSLSGFRVFGEGEGSLPKEVSNLAVKTGKGDKRRYDISWKRQDNTTGYIVRWGVKPGQLNNSWMIFSNHLEAGCFNSTSDYYFAVDAFNENGITISSDYTPPFPIDENFDIFKTLDKQGIEYKTVNFAGYECAEFLQNGRECKVVKPKKTAANHPWIWQARFFGHEPQTAIALLERGYHFVYCDQAERMGNKQSIEEWNAFYKLLHDGGLNQKVVLEGMSRGAVYVFNWAAANPDKVAAVYVDNPLLDMKAMYFGPNGEEKPENEISRGIRENYHIERDQIEHFKESPIDKIDDIVKGHYPILILCAELDDAAVNSQNTFPFEKKIKEKGGDITVIVKKGFGHHPHSFPDPTIIVDFIENAVSRGETFFALTPPTAPFPMTKKYDSYKGLAMAGYQGWFSCPGDGSDRSWYHYWGRDSTFRPGSCKIDMWPDVSEYDKIYKTEFVFADGSPAYVMSSYDESTVKTHFRWMREYGIDGVFVQRFVAEIKRPKSYNQLNKVWHSAIQAANANNRAISIMYDLSGMTPGDEQLVLMDIDSIAKHYDIYERINNPSYLHHNGKPLVAVWGVGFDDKRKYGFKEAEIIIDALIDRGFSVLIGVPTHWRRLEGDTMNDPELHRLIKKCDIVMPWFVGRYNEQTFPQYEKLVKEDMKWCKKNKVDYAPLAFPGFSWVNMAKNSKPIPRNRGSFYWQQLSSHINNGAKMLYLAMFDEIDEGTAIFKCATEVPVGESYFLALDKDLGSDYYLKLAGKAAKMLKK